MRSIRNITVSMNRSVVIGGIRWIGSNAMLVFITISFLFAAPSIAQMVDADFEVDIVAARSDDGLGRPKVDIYTRVSVTQMSFVRSATGFTAGYDITLDAIEWDEEDRLRNLVQSRI
ncbi:MAG: hypothetical protein ACO37D_11570, partial [Rhodothermales bacterium]